MGRPRRVRSGTRGRAAEAGAGRPGRVRERRQCVTATTSTPLFHKLRDDGLAYAADHAAGPVRPRGVRPPSGRRRQASHQRRTPPPPSAGRRLPDPGRPCTPRDQPAQPRGPEHLRHGRAGRRPPPLQRPHRQPRLARAARPDEHLPLAVGAHQPAVGRPRLRRGHPRSSPCGPPSGTPRAPPRSGGTSRPGPPSSASSCRPSSPLAGSLWLGFGAAHTVGTVLLAFAYSLYSTSRGIQFGALRFRHVAMWDTVAGGLALVAVTLVLVLDLTALALLPSPWATPCSPPSRGRPASQQRVDARPAPRDRPLRPLRRAQRGRERGPAPALPARGPLVRRSGRGR